MSLLLRNYLFTDGGGSDLIFVHNVFLSLSKADNDNLWILFNLIEHFGPIRFLSDIQPREFEIFKSAVGREWNKLVLYAFFRGFLGQVDDIEFAISLAERENTDVNQ